MVRNALQAGPEQTARALAPRSAPRFKAYDIRGRVPDELNVDIAFRLGLAHAERVTPGCVALGRDIRHSSLDLQRALAHGLAARGVELDLGLCGTEEIRPRNIMADTVRAVLTARTKAVFNSGIALVYSLPGPA